MRMLRTKKKTIAAILFHTIGGGAFKKLSDECIVSKEDWLELKRNIQKLTQIWKGKMKIEKVVAYALFDIERNSRYAARKCSESIVKEIHNITADLEISKLFTYLPDGAFMLPENAVRSISEDIEYSEQELKHCIIFHSDRGGAFRQARSFRKFDPDGWRSIISAIKKLKTFWKEREFIDRVTALALVNLPLYVEWQADFFRRQDPNLIEVKQFTDVADELSIAIKYLLE
jgi:hypothetical protein